MPIYEDRRRMCGNCKILHMNPMFLVYVYSNMSHMPVDEFELCGMGCALALMSKQSAKSYFAEIKLIKTGVGLARVS